MVLHVCLSIAGIACATLGLIKHTCDNECKGNIRRNAIEEFLQKKFVQGKKECLTNGQECAHSGSCQHQWRWAFLFILRDFYMCDLFIFEIWGNSLYKVTSTATVFRMPDIWAISSFDFIISLYFRMENIDAKNICHLTLISINAMPVTFEASYDTVSLPMTCHLFVQTANSSSVVYSTVLVLLCKDEVQ